MRHLSNPFKAFAVFAAMIALMAFLGSCGVKSDRSHKFMIQEGSGRTSWTDSYIETNGCVTFVDECESPTRICGTYTIVTQK
jgi:hypothetical protein